MNTRSPEQSRNRRKQIWQSVIWLSLMLVGFVGLLEYQTTSGAITRPPGQWPGPTRLERSTRQYTALLFLHPKCPCSRATLNQFEKLLALNPETNAYAVFIKPHDVDVDWCNSPLVESCRKLSQVKTIIDNGETEEKLFGARTSGLILCYNPQGELSFAGGITPGRGHEGDSYGYDELNKILAGSARERAKQSPVYGCALSNDIPCRAGAAEK